MHQLQNNIAWSGKLEKDEYNASGTINQSMESIWHFFNYNAGVFDEMRLYRHFAKYNLNIEAYRHNFNNIKIAVRRDMLKLSNVIQDVAMLSRDTA